MKYLNLILFLLCSFLNVRVKAWEIDFSRRQVDFQKTEDVRMPASQEETTLSLISKIVNQVEPAQDIVILNTETGFIPEVIKLKKGANYNVHVVNVNSKEKNVSFMLDAFAQNHSTLFGAKTTFNVVPRTEGVFSFQCPETSKQGKLVIISDEPKKKVERTTASEEKTKN